jgi:hypothetical protein
MSNARLLTEVDRLVDLLHKGRPIELGAIPWASPVLAFGDPVNSRVATLGLNPSNLEFVDRHGRELHAPHHRFESLTTLRASSWGEVASRGVRSVWQACENYFYGNPYDQWFKRLEKLLVGTGASYYTSFGVKACHLDLVPFATAEKWSSLTNIERAQLIQLGTPSLVKTIIASDVRVLVLNGSAVVKEFNRLVPDEPLETRPMSSWSLQDGRVPGVGYIGRISRLGGLELDRELLVLGYNHNIQSSFGVTSEAISRMATWISRCSAGALA